MGMLTHVVGLRQADKQWNKMKAVWEACEEAGAKIPTEVEEFFDFESPDNKSGMEVSLGDACEEYSIDGENGYEIDISKLPEHISIIRVYNSW